MYNVDINFLKNRPEYQNLSAPVDRAGSSTTTTSNYSKAPIFVGLGIGLSAALATGAMWALSDKHGNELQARQVELDKQLGAAKVQEAKLTALQGQVAQTEQENQALAGAFNLVRPWSAIMQEFKEITPQGVQISSLTQSFGTAAAPAAPAPKAAVPGATATKLAAGPPTVDASGAATKGAPAASPAPAVAAAPTVTDGPVTKIDLDGIASSYNEVNSFILILKQSPFFNPDDTQLINAELVTSTVNVSAQSGGANPQTATTTTATTKSVKYKIQTSLKQISASELLRELERKGAEGLVTRLKTLQQQKVIKP
jgi:type IV pilus assembly protein PilN